MGIASFPLSEKKKHDSQLIPRRNIMKEESSPTYLWVAFYRNHSWSMQLENAAEKAEDD